MTMNFDDNLNEILTSMVEIGLEYIDYNKEIFNTVYIYGCLENSISFDFFYKINNKIVQKHQINNLTKIKFDTSDELQIKAMHLGILDLEKLLELFKNSSREIPLHIKLIYNIQTGSFDSRLIYDKLLTDDLISDDIFEEWIEELENL